MKVSPSVRGVRTNTIRWPDVAGPPSSGISDAGALKWEQTQQERIRCAIACGRRRESGWSPPLLPHYFGYRGVWEEQGVSYPRAGAAGAVRLPAAVATAVATLRSVCSQLPSEHRPQKKDVSKVGKWGAMQSAGHRGGRSKYHVGFDQDAEMAAALLGLVPTAVGLRCTGCDKSGLQDARSLREYGRCCVYATVNFSHAPAGNEREDAESLVVPAVVHRDSNDQSMTILLLWQHPDAPPYSRAAWYYERTGTYRQIVGAFAQVFDGRRQFHGVIPPSRFCRRWPWYGATLVVKAVNPHRPSQR